MCRRHTPPGHTAHQTGAFDPRPFPGHALHNPTRVSRHLSADLCTYNTPPNSDAARPCTSTFSRVSRLFIFCFFIYIYAQKRHGSVRPAIGALVRPSGCTTERAASAATKAATRVAIKDAGRDFTNPDERVAHPDLRCAPAVPVPGVTFTVLRARTAKATASRHGTRTPQRREARTEQRLVSPPPGKEQTLLSSSSQSERCSETRDRPPRKGERH